MDGGCFQARFRPVLGPDVCSTHYVSEECSRQSCQVISCRRLGAGVGRRCLWLSFCLLLPPAGGGPNVTFLGGGVPTLTPNRGSSLPRRHSGPPLLSYFCPQHSTPAHVLCAHIFFKHRMSPSLGHSAPRDFCVWHLSRRLERYTGRAQCSRHTVWEAEPGWCPHLRSRP